MRQSTIEKFFEWRFLFCDECVRKDCTRKNNLKCIELCLILASIQSDIAEGKYGSSGKKKK